MQTATAMTSVLSKAIRKEKVTTSRSFSWSFEREKNARTFQFNYPLWIDLMEVKFEYSHEYSQMQEKKYFVCTYTNDTPYVRPLHKSMLIKIFSLLNEYLHLWAVHTHSDFYQCIEFMCHRLKCTGFLFNSGREWNVSHLEYFPKILLLP